MQLQGTSVDHERQRRIQKTFMSVDCEEAASAQVGRGYFFSPDRAFSQVGRHGLFSRPLQIRRRQRFHLCNGPAET
jgi:hypothetical protein